VSMQIAMPNSQNNYSELYSHELDDLSRKTKALKTLAVLKDSISDDLSGLDVLEVGCFAGEIGLAIAEYFNSYRAIDIDKKAISLAEQKNSHRNKNIHFEVMNAEMLKFNDNSFDIVICSHVYEHVSNPQKMMDEIYRVLKIGGGCYFAAGNRLVFMEPHHRLPFLSCLPKRLASGYLKIFKGLSPYYETHLTIFSLRKLVKKYLMIDYTKNVINEPDKFHATDMVQQGTIKQRLSLLFIKVFYWFSPTYIWILKK
jgi:ubiquinone/menaquinone biosynthesis C-methylase UbiE